LLREIPARVHDVVSHAIPAVPAITRPGADVGVVSGTALVSRSGAPLHGEHSDDAQTASRAGIPEPRPLAAPGRNRVVPPAEQGVPASAEAGRRLRGASGRREE